VDEIAWSFGQGLLRNAPNVGASELEKSITIRISGVHSFNINRLVTGSVAIAAHDAGAANLIASWFSAYNSPMKVCTEGPARSIFLQDCARYPIGSLDVVIPWASTLISGTGWQGSIDHDARVKARSIGIRSIAVLDHWTNYRDRFIRNGELILPDEIWVADIHAEIEARRCFPGLPVLRLPNIYLEKLASNVAAIGPTPASRNPHNILYTLEPVRQDWGRSGEPGEFQALAFFLESLPALGIDGDVKIRLRPHPSDPPGKYDNWLRRYTTFDLTVDDSGALAEQIAWADWVVGCETFALVIAMQAGRIAVSSLPPWAPPCRLPQQDLLHLRDLVARVV